MFALLLPARENKKKWNIPRLSSTRKNRMCKSLKMYNIKIYNRVAVYYRHIWRCVKKSLLKCLFHSVILIFFSADFVNKSISFLYFRSLKNRLSPSKIHLLQKSYEYSFQNCVSNGNLEKWPTWDRNGLFMHGCGKKRKKGKSDWKGDHLKQP